MIQRREKLRFPLEPPKALVVLRERFGQHLNRDLTVELRITRAVDLTHSARSDGSDDLVVGELRSYFEAHIQEHLNKKPYHAGGFGIVSRLYIGESEADGTRPALQEVSANIENSIFSVYAITVYTEIEA